MISGGLASRESRSDNPGAYLSLQYLHKAYHGVPAVRDVSLSAAKASVLVLLGPSGCGKTTTLNMIAGFVRPDRGEILLAGRTITALPVQRRGIGMVFQRHALFPHMTVHANVAYGLHRRAVPRAEVRRRVGEMLETVGLSQFHKRLPHQLSGGQQQRVALARALVVHPDVLLMDEPLSALDTQLRVEMRQEIRRLVDAQQVTAVLVTHDRDEALMLGDRVAVLDAGLVRQVGTPRELYESPADGFVARFVGQTVSWPGTARTVEGAVVTVSAGDAVLRGVDASGRVRAGDPVEVVVRPEHIHAVGADAPQGADENRWVGVVDAQLFLGPVTQLQFAGPPPISVSVPADRRIEAGVKYALSWSLSRTYVFAGRSS